MTQVSVLVEQIRQKFAEAELYRNQGLYDDARGIYEELLRLIPAKDIKLRDRITATVERLPQEGSLVGARVANKATESDADQKALENAVGLMDAGFFPEAYEELAILSKKNIAPATVNARLGICCLNLNHPFAALEFLEKAAGAEMPSTAEKLDVLDRLSLAYEATGAIPSAIHCLEKIVGVDPTFRNAAGRLKHISKTAQRSGRHFRLVQNKQLTMEDLDKARVLAKQKNRTIDYIILNEMQISKSELGGSLSAYYNCPFIEFVEADVGPSPVCIKGIKEHFFRTNVFIPIREDGGIVTVALDNPNDLVKTDNIKSVLKNQRVEFVVGIQEDIDKFIDFFFGKFTMNEESGEEKGDLFEQLEIEKEESDEEGGEDFVSAAEGVVVQMANKIIEDAITTGASDIHIESQMGKRGVQVRFRVDGQCRFYRNIPVNYKRSLVSRIKILSKLDISEKRLPQDGKIKFQTRSRKKIELRVATIPTVGGNEDVVLRILASSNALPLDKAGLLDHNLKEFKRIIDMPYGLIAVVGPTGSGKTTTLHAALNYLNQPETKIWTVEDPVEIVQEGLRQVQVQNKIDLDFARVLKAFLRADPDVIMVGETRDRETASTVIEASLTGHLVLTTLHTNTAPETVTRLLGMGIDSYNFSESLLGILAQRLVRTLCAKCKKTEAIGEELRQNVLEAYGPHPNRPLLESELASGVHAIAVGCPVCSNSGFKGRLAIHELLSSNDHLKRLIARNATVAEIRDAAMENGMLSLLQDGTLKVLRGDTDLNVVRAVCIR